MHAAEASRAVAAALATAIVWDYIDDNYSYYNNAINEAAVRLGLAYADYLQAGGGALVLSALCHCGGACANLSDLKNSVFSRLSPALSSKRSIAERVCLRLTETRQTAAGRWVGSCRSSARSWTWIPGRRSEE